MNIIRATFRQKCFPGSRLHSGPVNSLLRNSPRLLSTETDGTQVPNFSPDSLTQSPGVTYGILIGTIKNTLRSDVVNLLEGCDLSLEDVKTVYGQTFMPISILVKFHSPSAYEKAVKFITKNRLYRLDRAEPSQWFKTRDYGAKTLLLEGLPRMASRDDVERFLSDWDYVPYNTLMITRPGVAEPIKTAVVPVSSPIQAMNMFLAKNRSYMGNNQVLVRVLQ
ncbi:unnamed protein product [Rhodiola kirilowii]